MTVNIVLAALLLLWVVSIMPPKVCVCVHNYYRLTRFWVSGLVVLVVPPGHTRLAHAPVLDPSCCCNRLRLSQNQVLWLMV